MSARRQPMALEPRRTRLDRVRTQAAVTWLTVLLEQLRARRVLRRGRR